MITISPLENIKDIHSECCKAKVILSATTLDYYCSKCNKICSAGGDYKIQLRPPRFIKTVRKVC